MFFLCLSPTHKYGAFHTGCALSQISHRAFFSFIPPSLRPPSRVLQSPWRSRLKTSPVRRSSLFFRPGDFTCSIETPLPPRLNVPLVLSIPRVSERQMPIRFLIFFLLGKFTSCGTLFLRSIISFLPFLIPLCWQSLFPLFQLDNFPRS